MKHATEYRDKNLSQALVRRIAETVQTPVRLMEVCGTHTVSIFRSGIRNLLPRNLSLLSGPGCPVCVTAQGEIDAFIALARKKEVIITTFGDLARVPGSGSSLQKESAAGCDIRLVYSTSDALDIAGANPDRQIVFLGVGFETTAPTIAAAVLSAERLHLGNFSVLCAHKTVPPALDALMNTSGARIDGFLLPGHVSVIIGSAAYHPFVETHRVPCVIAGFEPMDILQAILRLVQQIRSKTAGLENAYPRAVTAEGNMKAQALLKQVFMPVDAEWRGLGVIPASGLDLRPEYARYDARKRFAIPVIQAAPPKGCACGDILIGRKTPPECALYKTSCTPLDPVGPCMVSSEGTCAAFYKYHQAS